MKISLLRAKRLAVVVLLKAEKLRQQEREAEAAFYSEKSAQQSMHADNLCQNCGKDYFINETIVDGELKCSCTIR